MQTIMSLLGTTTATDAAWLIVGLLGQLMFTARFLVQWLASEQAGKSVVPVAFWYFSIAGGVIVLAYGIHKLEPVIILGQLPGVVIYSRNLWLISRENNGQRV
ncbi:lipid-A-disaccharide synthase N-terminal domain-containing protein [Tabrizicola sp.]|uniref:lipid-A-disaccharide synthase N-terminal domain-containing protein n=1 Tax=Tabrizicola sp. TaxID=2005166 RepID=UPI00286D1A1D|nr:lipid-A-disaccharide synthase N-terminal domain-containing protein [Tabrizicola sp.]